MSHSNRPQRQGADYFRYRSGLNSVGAYQISGIPFASSSIKAPLPSLTEGAALEISFPHITKWITIENVGISGSADRNGGADLRVGFSENGITGRSNNNYFVVPATVAEPSGSLSANSRITIDVRVSSIFLMSNSDQFRARCQIIAGMTTIATGSIVSFTNWTGSLGVG